MSPKSGEGMAGAGGATGALGAFGAFGAPGAFGTLVFPTFGFRERTGTAPRTALGTRFPRLGFGVRALVTFFIPYIAVFLFNLREFN